MIRLLIVFLFVVVTRALAASLGEPLTFTGTCDASAAVALGGDLFVVANDEDNHLRFYRLSQPGPPLQEYNLGPVLSGRKKGPEADIEGAARLGARCFFVTSHGRDAEGKFAPSRHRLFALEFKVQDANVTIQPIGRPYTNLLSDLSRDRRLGRFHLAEASRLAPKEPGGLNIEALTDTPDGTLLIGFRSPIPEGRALLVPLLNPNETLTGASAKFGEPRLLDLGGLGLRGIGSTARGYYLIAGPADSGPGCRLFFWEGGDSTPRPVAGIQFSGINPEGISFHDMEGKSDFVILSDDGGMNVGGKECKDLPEAQRRFRAFRLNP